MDNHLVYVKTPIGDEAVRQSTRVVKRNLRMVLVQVDGKLSVAELSDKIGNPQMVEAALRELESDGFIAPTLEGVSVWEAAKARAAAPVSEFSTFGPMAGASSNSGYSKAMASNFSDFGKLNQANRPYENRLPDAPGVMVAEKREVFSDRKPLPWGALVFSRNPCCASCWCGNTAFLSVREVIAGSRSGRQSIPEDAGKDRFATNQIFAKTGTGLVKHPAW
jgi:predicted transcriptional regulator